MTNSNRYFFDIIPIDYHCSEEQAIEILEKFPAPELPDGNTYFDLQDQQEGNSIKQRLLLNEYEVRLTRTNKQFLKMSFSNNAGMIQAKMWDNQGAIDRYLPLLEAHTIFEVEGVVDVFNGNKSITVNRLTAQHEDVNPFALLPYTKMDIPNLTVELFSYLHELSEPYQSIAIAAMEHFWNDFRLAPAAKGYHHNYLGGLLKHTIGLMRITRYICTIEKDHVEAIIKLIQVVEKAYKKEIYQSYKTENDQSNPLVWRDTIDHLYKMLQGLIACKEETPPYDLLITAILYHDIGKLLEYDHAGLSFHPFKFLFPTADHKILSDRKQAGIAMDSLGVMVGHIPYGMLLLTKIIETEKIELPVAAIHELIHCILCHHGLPEWGSAVRAPQTLSGYLIHIVDYLDSRFENTELVK
ncbi:3'-5' exoribonuclease [Natronobacillus azotifigens]|uniref:HD domain-containing protein n=1 Tax=Natronobacillus azotifigens TaxID=472978 RepID=A0A9J6RD86_9BACI|nr:HD domain-containing protein [Natronobacillus azotifigens]MCZ0703315.1 HD domain-containing protein [Natronobacillus azotifigens]